MRTQNTEGNCQEFIHFMGHDNAAMFGTIINEIYKIYGTDGLKAIERAMEQKGRLDALTLKDSGITINSFKDFGKYYGMSLRGQVNSIISPTKMEIISPDEVVLVHTSCTKYHAWKDIGLSAEMVRETCRLYFKATESLFFELFPDAKMVKETLIPNGDDVCRIRFKR
ncbi:MAG: hypothetical protein SCH39_06800 [Methanosarcinales archaeon]|nr:hypothetical protein [Methanosarcinales archaeon]